MIGIYQQYKKLKDDPSYINNNSKHPSTVIKQIPKAISRSTSDISWSKEICDQNISYYNYDLKYKGYENISLPYSPDTRTRAG